MYPANSQGKRKGLVGGIAGGKVPPAPCALNHITDLGNIKVFQCGGMEVTRAIKRFLQASH